MTEFWKMCGVFFALYPSRVKRSAAPDRSVGRDNFADESGRRYA
jgi:hypothetical protein